MKNKIAILVVSSILMLMGLLFGGCGNSDKFAGDWVGEVGYNTQEPFYNKLSLESFHIEKSGSSNLYTFEGHLWAMGVDKKEINRPAVNITGNNPKDSNMLNLPDARETLIYDEKDKKLHIKEGDQDIVYERVKSDKEIDAIKARVSQFIDEHMEDMQKIQDSRDIPLGWKDGNMTDAQIKEAKALIKPLRDEVDNYKFKD